MGDGDNLTKSYCAAAFEWLRYLPDRVGGEIVERDAKQAEIALTAWANAEKRTEAKLEVVRGQRDRALQTASQLREKLDLAMRVAASHQAKEESASPASEPERQKIDRRWEEYPAGTRAHAASGGSWMKRDDGHWKWQTPNDSGGAFLRPGGDAVAVTLPLTDPAPSDRKERNVTEALTCACGMISYFKTGECFSCGTVGRSTDLPEPSEALEACKDCGSDDLFWSLMARNNGVAVDGRLSLSEIEPLLTLSCGECSATVRVINSDQVDSALSQPAPAVPDGWAKKKIDEFRCSGGELRELGDHGSADVLEGLADDMERALAQPSESPAVPDGYVLVPKEPTDDMIQAAALSPCGARECLRAAIAAAPTPTDHEDGL